MKRISLSGWAAIAEIVGGIAVVISLLMVAYTVSQNTIALRASSEETLYTANRELNMAFMTNAELQEIVSRLRQRDQELTDRQNVAWEAYHGLMLNIWENAFDRYKRGLLTEETWQDWDRYFGGYLADKSEGLSNDLWSDTRTWYSDDFQGHVDATLFSRD